MFRYVLLLAIPLSIGLRYVLDVSSLWVFVASAAALAILAEWIRRATGQLAQHAGPSIGGLLTVSFGSIAELVLALFVLASGKAQVVQAQITRSILGTGLFGLGWPSSSAASDETGKPSRPRSRACFRRCSRSS